MRRIAPALLLLSFTFVASPAWAETATLTVDHSAWDQILHANVKDGLVDYSAIRDHSLPQLTAYLDKIADTDAEALAHDEQLALYINLYNASMVKAICDRYTPWYSVVEKKSAIFSEPLVRVSHKTMSLNDLEHGIIRAQFKDPRVHASLVCAGLSCPPLPNHAFVAANLSATLDQVMSAWIHNPKHNRIDDAAHHLTLSKIFLWYTDDFGGADKLGPFVSKYLGRDVSGYSVSFYQYDFRLNDMDTSGRP
jgi:hypothetical protein